MQVPHDVLRAFVAESNAIEGIDRAPTAEEMQTHSMFVALREPTATALRTFVSVVQPDAQLRDRVGVPGVRVGRHEAPPSGPDVREDLEYILRAATEPSGGMTRYGYYTGALRPGDAFSVHRAYEHLHPFTDGNGRSGRTLWLWMVRRSSEWWPTLVHCRGSFLRTWYYMSLADGDRR